LHTLPGTRLTQLTCGLAFVYDPEPDLIDLLRRLHILDF
jgi:hypothetical protein